MKRTLTRRSFAPFELTLPATSANLGPAFDAAALALSLFLKVRARVALEFSIVARGRDSEICGRLENHLILTTYREVLEANGKPVLPLTLRLDNGIPIGKGCGSSAAARLAGIALANHYGTLNLSAEQVVGEASRREHHPDNAAACWFGGLAVARIGENREAKFARLMPKGKWPLLLAVPNAKLSTAKARSVLPLRYSRMDTVSNIQNSMLLLAAFVQGSHDLLAEVLCDRLHQPYRAALCPLLPALEQLDRTTGVLGVALSGAGPSVLLFIDPKSDVRRVTARVRRHLQALSLPTELIATGISARGAGR